MDATACPGCKETLLEPSTLPQRLATARGYAISIGLMVLMPVGLIGAVTTAIVRTARRAKPPL